MKVLTRNSNIELIRIIAMLFVVIGHIVLHGTKDNLDGSFLIKSITCTGVNLFVLISGYFNIKLSVKSLLKILGIVFFYNLLSLSVSVIFWSQSVSLLDVVNILFPVSRHGLYWFVSCYITLMLLSPAINLILNRFSKGQYLFFLGVMTYLCCISGWLFHNPVNIHGYTVMNMIFLYVLGDCIRKFSIAEYFRPIQWILIYMISTFCIGIMYNYFFSVRAFFYNNPVLILSACSLFCFVLRFDFQNKWVNKLATYMFPVYLFQEGYVGQILYNKLYLIGEQTSFAINFLLYIYIYIISLFFITFLIENVRRYFSNKFLIGAVDKIISRLRIQ